MKKNCQQKIRKQRQFCQIYYYNQRLLQDEGFLENLKNGDKD